MKRRRFSPSAPTSLSRNPSRADNADDAVKISLTYRNKIDPEYVGQLLGIEDAEQVKKELVGKDLAFVNPDGGLMEAPFEYLSGNVRAKLEKAEEAAKDDPIYDKNVQALKRVQPEDLKVDQIYFRLGTPWVPTESVEDFIREVLHMDASVSHTQTEEMSRFSVTTTDSLSAEAKNTYGTERADAISLIDDTLNLRFTTIYDVWEEPNGTEHRELNKEATAAAKDMQRRINERFIEWAKNSEKWGPEYATVYNRDMNNSVLMEVPVPDLKHYPNASTEITLYPHQKRAVSRGLMQSYLAAHEVGTGKTFIFATLAMEMRRLGTARKPMIVVHNSTVHQYAKAFRQLYPTANILVPDYNRLQAKNRKKLLGQIATQEFDAIVVPQSWFDMLSVSPEKEAAYIQTQVAEIEELIRQKEAEGEDKRKIRQIEKMKENKEAQISGPPRPGKQGRAPLVRGPEHRRPPHRRGPRLQTVRVFQQDAQHQGDRPGDRGEEHQAFPQKQGSPGEDRREKHRHRDRHADFQHDRRGLVDAPLRPARPPGSIQFQRISIPSPGTSAASSRTWKRPNPGASRWSSGSPATSTARSS